MTPIRTLLLGFLLILVVGLAGCGDCLRCDQERDRTLTQTGEPDERSTQVDGHIMTETWIYWEESRSVVFLWDDRDCSCDVSVYDFETDALLSGIRTHGSSFFKP